MPGETLLTRENRLYEICKWKKNVFIFVMCVFFKSISPLISGEEVLCSQSLSGIFILDLFLFPATSDTPLLSF